MATRDNPIPPDIPCNRCRAVLPAVELLPLIGELLCGRCFESAFREVKREQRNPEPERAA